MDGVCAGFLTVIAVVGHTPHISVTTYVCVCVHIYIYIYILQVENDGAMRGICYISVPSQLIALVPATSPRLHKEILYANDSLSC